MSTTSRKTVLGNYLHSRMERRANTPSVMPAKSAKKKTAAKKKKTAAKKAERECKYGRRPEVHPKTGKKLKTGGKCKDDPDKKKKEYRAKVASDRQMRAMLLPQLTELPAYKASK